MKESEGDYRRDYWRDQFASQAFEKQARQLVLDPGGVSELKTRKNEVIGKKASINPRKAFEQVLEKQAAECPTCAEKQTTLKRIVKQAAYGKDSRTIVKDALAQVLAAMHSLEKAMSLVSATRSELFEAYQIPEGIEEQKLVWIDERLKELYTRGDLVNGKIAEAFDAVNKMRIDLKRI